MFFLIWLIILVKFMFSIFGKVGVKGKFVFICWIIIFIVLILVVVIFIIICLGLIFGFLSFVDVNMLVLLKFLIIVVFIGFVLLK